MTQEKRDAIAGVVGSLKLGQKVLGGLAQHLQDAATLVKEVVERRKEVAEWSARTLRWKRRADALQKQLDALGLVTDRLGFGKRMA